MRPYRSGRGGTTAPGTDVGWSDLARFGMAYVLVGVAVVRETGGAVRWLGLPLAALGLGMVARAVARRLKRTDDATTEPRQAGGFEDRRHVLRLTYRFA